jgi:hypothetical protein
VGRAWRALFVDKNTCAGRARTGSAARRAHHTKRPLRAQHSVPLPLLLPLPLTLRFEKRLIER